MLTSRVLKIKQVDTYFKSFKDKTSRYYTYFRDLNIKQVDTYFRDLKIKQVDTYLKRSKDKTSRYLL